MGLRPELRGLAEDLFELTQRDSIRTNAPSGIYAFKTGERGKVYREWIMPYVGNCMNKQISIDGKTVCGVARASGKTSKLHVVSAWVKEDGISFGQIRTEEKSNEHPL